MNGVSKILKLNFNPLNVTMKTTIGKNHQLKHCRKGFEVSVVINCPAAKNGNKKISIWVFIENEISEFISNVLLSGNFDLELNEADVCTRTRTRPLSAMLTSFCPNSNWESLKETDFVWLCFRKVWILPDKLKGSYLCTTGAVLEEIPKESIILFPTAVLQWSRRGTE